MWVDGAHQWFQRRREWSCGFCCSARRPRHRESTVDHPGTGRDSGLERRERERESQLSQKHTKNIMISSFGSLRLLMINDQS